MIKHRATVFIRPQHTHILKTNVKPRKHCKIVKRKQAFLQSTHGRKYGYSSTAKGHIDTWRGKEFPSLILPISLTSTNSQSLHVNNTHTHLPSSHDKNVEREVFLDYAGSAIPSQSLLQAIFKESIQNQILANPHSNGPAASRTESQIDEVKKELLDFFHANAGPKYGYQSEKILQAGEGDHCEEDYHSGYEVIFTSGTTQALQIVAENFAWDDGRERDGTGKSMLVYSHNSHTSVVGMREPAMRRGALFQCQTLDDIEMAGAKEFESWGGDSFQDKLKDNGNCNGNDDGDGNGNGNDDGNNEDGYTYDFGSGAKGRNGYRTEAATKHLLAFPLECNFSGRKSKAQQIIRASRSAKSGTWYSMLDIAKAASTSTVNLRTLDPDFACISFYKIFGAPTGIGALFVKRSSKTVLAPEWNDSLKRRRYFGGGSVDIQLPFRDFARPRSSLASLVHGTINFRSILALRLGLVEIKQLSMGLVSSRICIIDMLKIYFGWLWKGSFPSFAHWTLDNKAYT